MTIEVSIRHRIERFALDVDFSSSGRLTALFGASGSGKTSVINVIAGMIVPEEGRVAVDGRVLLDTNAGIIVPRHKRRIGYVFQEPRLFPHLNVRQNLNYGAWFTPARERGADFAQVIDMLGIAPLLERRPSGLSGGEKQRVAIGRALLTTPRLLLMDEPLASLDDARKAEIMPYIERLRDESRVPIVYVSHALAEVTRLASDIVVMSHGRSIESGPASEIMQRLDVLPPEERSEAGAIIETVIESYDSAYDMSVLRSAAGAIRIPGRVGEPGAALRLRLKARDILVATEAPRKLSALNVLSGRVSGIGSATGPMVEIRIDCAGTPIIARITRQSLDALALAPGSNVYAIIKSVSFESAVSPGRIAGGRRENDDKRRHDLVDTG
jgi:molybdate transport system ATP-binding protein